MAVGLALICFLFFFDAVMMLFRRIDPGIQTILKRKAVVYAHCAQGHIMQQSDGRWSLVPRLHYATRDAAICFWCWLVGRCIQISKVAPESLKCISVLPDLVSSFNDLVLPPSQVSLLRAKLSTSCSILLSLEFTSTFVTVQSQKEVDLN